MMPTDGARCQEFQHLAGARMQCLSESAPASRASRAGSAHSSDGGAPSTAGGRRTSGGASSTSGGRRRTSGGARSTASGGRRTFGGARSTAGGGRHTAPRRAFHPRRRAVHRLRQTACRRRWRTGAVAQGRNPGHASGRSWRIAWHLSVARLVGTCDGRPGPDRHVAQRHPGRGCGSGGQQLPSAGMDDRLRGVACLVCVELAEAGTNVRRAGPVKSRAGARSTPLLLVGDGHVGRPRG